MPSTGDCLASGYIKNPEKTEALLTRVGETGFWGLEA